MAEYTLDVQLKIVGLQDEIVKLQEISRAADRHECYINAVYTIYNSFPEIATQHFSLTGQSKYYYSELAKVLEYAKIQVEKELAETTAKLKAVAGIKDEL